VSAKGGREGGREGSREGGREGGCLNAADGPKNESAEVWNQTEKLSASGKEGGRERGREGGRIPSWVCACGCFISRQAVATLLFPLPSLPPSLPPSPGNDLILWSEEALLLHGPQEEAAALTQAQELAQRYQLYLGITYHLYQPATLPPSPPPPPPPPPSLDIFSSPSSSSSSSSSARGLPTLEEGGREDEDGKEEGPYENVFALLTPEGTVGFR